MKKLLGIVVLGLFWSSYANAELKGIKEFYLEIWHEGSKCNGEKFNDEIKTSAKYIIGNSKIKLAKTMNAEYLKIYVLTGASDDVCASSIEVSSYSVGYLKNYSGHQFVGDKISYSSKRITGNSPPSAHKATVISATETELKEFVVAWNEANQ